MDNLKTTPWWWEAAEPETLAVHDVEPDCDCVVVGGGFAGLGAAIALAAAGRRVQVFDAEDPGRGASSRNGGMASGNLSYSLTAMIKKFGLDKARAYYREGREAREDLAAFISANDIDCDFEMTGRFTGSMTRAHQKAFAEECAALNDLAGIEATMVSRDDIRSEIDSDLYHGGMIRPDIGGLHPAKLHRGMLRVARQGGALIHGNNPVTGIEKSGGGFRVNTARGRTDTRDVIVATNGYTNSALPWLQRRVIPIASQIIVTEAIPDEAMARLFPNRRMHGESRRVFHYYRPSPDGKGILFGGRALAPLDQPRALATNLRERLSEVFPEMKDIGITHSWWGYIAATFDHLPHLHTHDGIRYATGFNGSGVVWARWLGQKAALDVLGENSAASAFATNSFPTRPLYHGKPWFIPAAIAWMRYRDRRDIARDKPNSGKI